MVLQLQLVLSYKEFSIFRLYKQGHQVVGIEAVENIVKEYFEEHSLAFNVLELSFGKLYQVSIKVFTFLSYCIILFIVGIKSVFVSDPTLRWPDRVASYLELNAIDLSFQNL